MSRARLLAAVPALLGVVVTVVLLLLADRYGYHRDEFYYLASGLHPALGYVDNPPLTPMIARLELALFGDSPTALRVIPAIASGLTVVVTGVIARELGGDRAAAALAAACATGSAFALATGHMLSTSTFDLLFWAVLSWLVVRALRDGGRVWLAVGAVAGIALENKALVAAFLGAVTLGVLAVGPRAAFRDRWLWAGVLVAVALWAPNLAWQVANGVPQLGMAQQIGSVGNGGSQPAWAFPLYQLVDVSPLLIPVWVIGWWTLARDPALRHARAFPVAYALLFVVLLAAGGKHYYLAGMYPVLLAAGAAPIVRWVRGARFVRRGLPVTAVVLVSLGVVAYLMLPLVPARSLDGSPPAAVSPIPADTVGWPQLVTTVAAVRDALPPGERDRAVVLGNNYGEAGAIDLFGRHTDLPRAYSGQNAYGTWGPPPETASTAIVIGYDEPTLHRWFGSVRPAARLDNGIGLDTMEQGRTVWVCTDRQASWTALWPQLRRLS